MGSQWDNRDYHVCRSCTVGFRRSHQECLCPKCEDIPEQFKADRRAAVEKFLEYADRPKRTER